MKSGRLREVVAYEKWPLVFVAKWTASLAQHLDGLASTDYGLSSGAGNFSSHSFRIGAATVAARNGVPDHLIQSMGCQKFRGGPHRMRLCIRNQLPEVLPTKTRQSISYLIVNPRHMSSRKGETMTSSRKKQATQ